MKQLPVAVGMLLCEKIIIEKDTENVTAVNCFHERRVREVPSEPLSFLLYAILTNGKGSITLSVVVQRLQDLAEVVHLDEVYDFKDPLSEFRCTVQLRALVFPSPGAYQVELLADGEFVAHRRFVIRQQGK
jgi:hypothetical protein